MHFKKVRNKNQYLSPVINIIDPAILAYSICPENENGSANCQHLIIDGNNTFLLENGMIIEQWVINQISYDSNGGEIITKEGDTIFISKNILIKGADGKEQYFEYSPIDVNLVNIKNEY